MEIYQANCLSKYLSLFCPPGQRHGWFTLIDFHGRLCSGLQQNIEGKSKCAHVTVEVNLVVALKLMPAVLHGQRMLLGCYCSFRFMMQSSIAMACIAVVFLHDQPSGYIWFAGVSSGFLFNQVSGLIVVVYLHALDSFSVSLFPGLLSALSQVLRACVNASLPERNYVTGI